MAEKEKDLAFVEFVIKAIVDNPDQVQLDRRVDEMGVLITLRVSKDDMGKIIGKEGQTAKSIRTLLRVIGAKNNARVNLKIDEPEGGSRSERPSVDKVVGDLDL
ncbi:MAG: KH domain-containing protein [bacterium]